MRELVALSFDSQASPAVSLRPRPPALREDHPVRGWGIGWYPGEGDAAATVRDPSTDDSGGLARVLRDWDRLRSTYFLSHLRLGSRPLDERDSQPFLRTQGGRQWLFVHAGDLTADLASACPLEASGHLEPLGPTDSEYAFCWLLSKLSAAGVRSLAELDPLQLRSWFARLNDVGTVTTALCDGRQLALYCDAHESQSLYWIRRLPPHERTHLESADLAIDFDAPQDPGRTMVVAATHPMSPEAWLPMEPGQLLLARRGAVVWSSHPDPSVVGFWSSRVMQAGGATGEPSAGTGLHEGGVQGQARVRPFRRRPPLFPQAEETRVLSVVHETIYRYAVPVERSSHRLRLRPVEDGRQQLLDWALEISVDGERRDFEDVFGNAATSYEIHHPFQELVVRCRSRVRVRPQPRLAASSATDPEPIPVVWMPWQRQMMLPYLLPPELPESQLRELTDFASSFVARNDSELLETLLDMNRTLYRDFEYVSGSTTLATTPFEVYRERRGVCQDFANLMICLARLLHVPARYRVGYIYTGGDYANKVQSEASHAWAELYLPLVGWQGFDPTNGALVHLDHVRVGAGRNYLDAAPTSGTIYKGGGPETLHIAVRVEECEGP